MHCPRIRFLPRNVILDKLYKVPRLKDKWLITSIHICPAYSMYLSNKCKRYTPRVPLAFDPCSTPQPAKGSRWRS